MRQSLSGSMQRKKAERELFAARRTLTHLVEIYSSGQWRRFYGQEAFVRAVRKARETVDHWTSVLGQLDGGPGKRGGFPAGRNKAPPAPPIASPPAGTKVTRVC
jgi:hypothetical protein